MRNYIQSKLNELTNIDCGDFIPDDIVESGKTYFGYTIQDNFKWRDNAKNKISTVSLIGFVVRRNSQDENTLQILDDSVKDIIEKLKEMNFNCSYSDVTLTDLRKIRIAGEVTYNEINRELI